tara:strand:- start:12345 stop:12578 length:234 start_codon:yes stop_codon:yes gene_type:complete
MELTPKEKAKELLKRFESVSKPFIKGSEVQVHIHPKHAKQSALICLDKMIKERQILNNDFDRERIKELLEIKQEINK